MSAKLRAILGDPFEGGDGFGGSGRGWSLSGGTHSAAKDAKHSYECHDLNVAALGDFGTLREERAGSRAREAAIRHRALMARRR
jgi:hypothetical protein